MKNHTAIIIAERNEPDLPNTLASILATAPHMEPVVIHDEQGAGPMRARHMGIVAACTADVVIITDGHMRFAPDALETLAAYVRKHPKHIATAYCHHNNAIEFEGTPYAAARIAWTDEQAGRHHTILAGKWREDRTAGKVGCVMGACYAFSREWYFEGLGAPWQFGTGWGCDEELISIANWLHGGENILLDVAVAHQSRDGGGQPFRYTPEQYASIWANRIRMLSLLPLTEAEQNELSAQLGRNRFNQHSKDMMDAALFRHGRPEPYRERLRQQKRTFAEWRLTWEGRDTENPITVAQLRRDLAALGIAHEKRATRADLARLLVNAAPPSGKPAPATPPPEPPPQVIIRQQERCKMCDAINPFRASSGPRLVGRVPVSYGRCHRCGHKMHVRFR